MTIVSPTETVLDDPLFSSVRASTFPEKPIQPELLGFEFPGPEAPAPVEEPLVIPEEEPLVFPVEEPLVFPEEEPL